MRVLKQRERLTEDFLHLKAITRQRGSAVIEHLDALNPETVTSEQIDAVLGYHFPNEILTCWECEQVRNELVEVGKDGDAFRICENCLQKASALFSSDPNAASLE